MTELNNPPSRHQPHGHSTRCAYQVKRQRTDMRTRPARRFRDAVAALCAEVGQPLTEMPESRRAIVRLAATFIVATEEAQAALAQGQAVDQEQLVRQANTLARLLADLGLSPAAGKPDPRAGLPTDAELRAKGINI
jgi:hypothetical protein